MTRMSHLPQNRRRSPNVSAGHYLLGQGVHVGTYGGEHFALCDYPLRVTHLTPTVAKLLSCSKEERTSKELAFLLKLPLARVEALCDQLRWKSLLDAGPPMPPTEWPNISIVIPSYNRARELERCVRSLLALTYPLHSLEVIVVDDASSDGTLEMLSRLTPMLASHSLRFHIIHHEQLCGVAIARNTGTQAATHDIIAYIDSDCVASPNWLTELVPYLQDAHVAMVGGEIRAYDCSSPIGRYEDVRSSLYMGVHIQQVNCKGPLTYLPTANLLIRKSTWQQLHGFEPLTQGEDVDFCRRLLTSGARILYVPQGTVYHDYRTRLRAFLGIRTAYATAEASLLLLHPTERRVLVLPPEQASFAGLIVGALWELLCYRTSRIARTIAFTTLLFALIHLLIGTHNRQRKLQRQHLPIVPIHTIFVATLRGHLAYTYHLCRHLTRYYTLPLLIIGLLVPPLLPITIVLCSIVIVVDYLRLKPDISFGRYALYALLDDCAYEWGVVKGCVKQRMWKPLWPIVKTRL